MSDDSFECRICRNTQGHRDYVVREMMFGRGEAFDYVECGACGCLQIKRIPEDLANYYPETYGSFQVPKPLDKSRWRRFLQRQRTAYCLRGHGLLGRLALRVLGSRHADIWGDPDPTTWLRRCGIDFEARIADIGCGSGSLLIALQEDGFEDLTGFDPLVPSAIDYGHGLRIHDRELDETDGTFDVLMMHHAFEHVTDPRRTLRSLRDHLRPDGRAILRMPVVPCFAFRTYGVDWLQLDAPRHLHIQSPAGLEKLAAEEGLVVVEVEWDSFGAQFWGSEQYRENIALVDERSHMTNPKGSIFSTQQLEAWERQSTELNAAKDGDQACFYLSRAS